MGHAFDEISNHKLHLKFLSDRVQYNSEWNVNNEDEFRSYNMEHILSFKILKFTYAEVH